MVTKTATGTVELTRDFIQVAYVYKGHYHSFEMRLEGLTVAKALQEIKRELASKGLVMQSPYYLNKKEVKVNNKTVLKQGDTLIVDP